MGKKWTKELFMANKRSWEEYDELKLAKSQKKKLKIADIKLFLFGLVFFICGFFRSYRELSL